MRETEGKRKYGFLIKFIMIKQESSSQFHSPKLGSWQRKICNLHFHFTIVNCVEKKFVNKAEVDVDFFFSELFVDYSIQL